MTHKYQGGVEVFVILPPPFFRVEIEPIDALEKRPQDILEIAFHRRSATQMTCGTCDGRTTWDGLALPFAVVGAIHDPLCQCRCGPRAGAVVRVEGIFKLAQLRKVVYSLLVK